MNKKIVTFVVVLGILILVGWISYSKIFYFNLNGGEKNSKNDSNELDTGSPTPPIIEGWKTFVDGQQGVEFQYPENLETRYIFLQKWPPQIQISSEQFFCDETIGAGISFQTIQKIIGNRLYCVELQSEGAAGSVYTTYIYTTKKDGKLVSLIFILRYSQCKNYDEADKNACELEFANFKLDSTIDRIIDSVNIKEEAVFCTMEAKLCPDGSYVGRTLPNCEFAPCP